jgi:glycosyltransferase 2 family protein
MTDFFAALRRGFHKHVGWKRVGIAASLIIITIAVLSLIRMLAGIDLAAVIDAIRQKSYGRIGLAALCVGCAFFTLTFYDLFALRTIGRRDVPYRIASLASFTSYTIGHNLGATVFTGGAIRFRIYSEWGLTPIDVAKICFISGLTFWLGNATVLGIGMALYPDAASAMNYLPESLNRLIALGLLASIVVYLAWLAMGPRQLGRNGWMIALPSARLTLLQIVIGVVDLGFCALAMYILMPDTPAISFMALAVIFIMATLLGFASHAPGSLGVFDAAMLLALPQFAREHIVASLLIFRLLYFVTPFAISLAVMGSREIWYNAIDPMLQRRKQRLSSARNVATQPPR